VDIMDQLLACSMLLPGRERCVTEYPKTNDLSNHPYLCVLRLVFVRVTKLPLLIYQKRPTRCCFGSKHGCMKPGPRALRDFHFTLPRFPSVRSSIWDL
jgi:hypothetical protein